MGGVRIKKHSNRNRLPHRFQQFRLGNTIIRIYLFICLELTNWPRKLPIFLQIELIKLF